MIEFFVLALLAVVGLSIAAIVGFVFFLLKMVLWVVFLPIKLLFLPIKLVFLPIKLLFKLMWLPFGLAFGTLGLGVGVVALPILFLVFGGVLIFGLIAAIVGLMLPLIPFLLLGLLLWSIFSRRPAAV